MADDKNAAFLTEAVSLGQKLGKPITDATEIPFAIVPNDSRMVSLLNEKYPYGLPKRKPEHIKAAVGLTDADSFCKYIKLYQDSRTRVFADPKAMSFRAVLDYHCANDAPKALPAAEPETAGATWVTSEATYTVAGAEFLDHQATLILRTSEQWNLWMAKNEKEIQQAEFAEFIEDNFRDISTPSPATMLEVARDLTATVEMNFASKVTPKSGAVKFAYQEVVTAGVGQAGDMEIPDAFTILIPVFFGEKPVSIEARLRFRVNGGKLRFIYKLYRPAELLSDAFKLAASAIGENLGLDVLLGSI
jgi:uncharacterized protein YfdQ (DUF2303 family)